MALPRGVAIALLLSVVQLSVCDGSASSIGQNDLLDADQQNMTTPTTSPVTASPLCPGKQDLLHVEASDEARKALVGWLAKDTARLIFIYFDLVVGNLTYHPGSCPDDGMSAIDAQTPLAWVLINGGPDGGPGALGTYSFAHAYLTLPVSYPRIYSLGILEGHYVATLRHKAYRMKVVVDNSTSVDAESCWKSLNKTEKTSLMFDVVESFVSNLNKGVTPQNTTPWSMCYSDITIDFKVHFGSLSMLVPSVPGYVCQDENGVMQNLGRESNLNRLTVSLLFVLSVGTVAAQIFLFSKALNLLWIWGKKKPCQLVSKRGKTFHKERFFNKSRLPIHVTVGGLLSSDLAFGQRVFFRLKLTVIGATYGILYAVWSNLLVHCVLYPSPSCVWSIVPHGFQVSSSETFDKQLPCQPFSSKFSGTVYFLSWYSIYCPIFVLFIIYHLLNPSGVFVSSAAVLKSNSIFAFALIPVFLISIFLKNLKHILQLPFKRPWLKIRGFGNPGRSVGKCTLFWAFVLAHALFWLPLFLVAEILILFSSVIEPFRLFPGIFPRQLIKSAFRFTLYLSQILFLFVFGKELVLFLTFSSVSLYITYPLETFLIVSWTLAFCSETQNVLQDYRSPLLAVQEKFVDKCMVLAEKHAGLEDTGRFPCVSTCSIYLKTVSDEGQNVDWKKFFKLSEKAWNKACLQVLLSTADDASVRDHISTRFWLKLLARVRTSTQRGENLVDKLVDVRAKTEDATELKLQIELWRRFLFGMMRLLFLLVIFLVIIILLVAFNSLLKSPNPKDTNSLLLTILIVPMYTFVRTKLSSSSLSSDESLLVEKVLDVELKKCFRNSLNHVSPDCQV